MSQSIMLDKCHAYLVQSKKYKERAKLYMAELNRIAKQYDSSLCVTDEHYGFTLCGDRLKLFMGYDGFNAIQKLPKHIINMCRCLRCGKQFYPYFYDTKNFCDDCVWEYENKGLAYDKFNPNQLTFI